LHPESVAAIAQAMAPTVARILLEEAERRRTDAVGAGELEEATDVRP